MFSHHFLVIGAELGAIRLVCKAGADVGPGGLVTQVGRQVV
jgi:hypothetical protein